MKRALTGAQFTPDPTVIFEVLSPSNGPQDRMARLADYSTVPSIEHSVVLHQDRPLATVHSRANGWEGRDVPPSDRIVDLPASACGCRSRRPTRIRRSTTSFSPKN